MTSRPLRKWAGAFASRRSPSSRRRRRRSAGLRPVVDQAGGRATHRKRCVGTAAERAKRRLILGKPHGESRAERIELLPDSVEFSTGLRGFLGHRPTELGVRELDAADRLIAPVKADGRLVQQRAQVRQISDLAVVLKGRTMAIALRFKRRRLSIGF